MSLIRCLPVPALLVRPLETVAGPTQESAFQHVLIPLDGSPLSEEILEPAVELGSSFRAEYTLLRVIPPMVQGLYGATDDLVARVDQRVLADLQAFHAADRAAAEGYLKRVAESLRAKSLKVNTRIAVHEQPAVAILDEIKAGRADVVALATHGRRGIPRLVLGSVADKVLRASPVPVLLNGPQRRSSKPA
jgi:nucleotide-binding universal stress UspA family protein